MNMKSDAFFGFKYSYQLKTAESIGEILSFTISQSSLENT